MILCSWTALSRTLRRYDTRHNLNGINLIKVSALATLNQVQCLKIVLVSYCLLSSTDSACLRISLQPAKVPIVLSDSGNLAQAQDDMSWTC